MKIWSDGSCDPNPGPGGWGWHRDDGVCDCGGEKQTTNNRMEMTAILEALSKLPDGQEVEVFSDSQYCVKGLTIWRSGWRKNSWKKKGEDMPNRDLWLQLETQMNRLKVEIKWVKGHNGDSGNELADSLARQGRAAAKSGDAKPRFIEKSLESRVAELELLVGTLWRYD